MEWFHGLTAARTVGPLKLGVLHELLHTHLRISLVHGHAGMPFDSNDADHAVERALDRLTLWRAVDDAAPCRLDKRISCSFQLNRLLVEKARSRLGPIEKTRLSRTSKLTGRPKIPDPPVPWLPTIGLVHIMAPHG